MAVVLHCSVHEVHPGDLLGHTWLGLTRVSDSGGLGSGLVIGTSTKCSGDVEAVDLRTTL